MGTRTTSIHGFALAAMLLSAPAPAAAQDFTKVTDAANPVVTLGGGPGGSFIGSCWVDSDGDGDLDLFIVRNGLFRNDGGGTFVHLPGSIVSQGAATGTTWADVDNDGDADAYVAGGTPSGSALYLNLGGNTFQKSLAGVMADTVAHRGWAAAFGDYDQDGLVDLVLAAPVGFNGVTGPNRLFHNEGGGMFTRMDTSTVATGLDFYTVPSWSDFDLDGDPDLFIGSGSGGGPLQADNLYRNRAETVPGWFERYTAAPLATDLHDGQVFNWIDYDNDGDLDAYLTNFGGHANDLYAATEAGYVRLTAAEVGAIVSDIGPSLASVWEDFDNDGDLDCYVTNAQTFAARFYRNDGGTFTALALGALTAAGPHWGASAADYDGDGAVDLYVNGTAATHGLFRNTTASGHHWLDVRLRGVLSNRSGIGARVRVLSTIGGTPRWQLREVSTQNSFDGMSRLDPHFGLAEGASVDSLVVEWPSGRRSVVIAPPVDGRVDVVEPDAVTAVTVALVGAEATSDRVRIVWALSASVLQPPVVEREEGAAVWRTIDGTTADGAGRVVLEDTAVAPGATYRYRLVVRDEDGVHRVGVVEVRVPVRITLAIRSVGPNPGSGPVRVAFEVPETTRAEIELVDVAGRRVDAWRGVPTAAGRHEIELGGGRRLAPGLYLVRLRQGGREVQERVTRVR